MTHKHCIITLVLLMLVGSIACADTVSSGDNCPPLEHAINRMAATLEVTPDAITVVACEQVDWPNTSLGVRRSRMMYLQVITPGYRIVLDGAGRRYEYHTDMKSRVILANISEGQTGSERKSVSAPLISDLCKADLAKRLQIAIDDIAVDLCNPQIFPDASLGLARPDEVYTQALVPGYILLLGYDRQQYLYTATDAGFRYGGPLDSWQYSALYLAQIPNEPNLNGNLMQVSLAGTNPTVLLAGVSDYYPQENGSVLAKRRTSRSGHHLLYLAPGQHSEVKILQSAFDFSDAAVNREGTRWAAGIRQVVGSAWEFAWGTFDGDSRQVRTISLPTERRVMRVYWNLSKPVIAMPGDDGVKFYELDLTAASPVWVEKASFFTPEDAQWYLNRSEMLVVKTTEIDGKPVTRVVREWFTGTERLLAAIPDFRMQFAEVAPWRSYVLVSGTHAEITQGFAVSLRTGEVLATVPQSDGLVRVLPAPPATWLWTNVLAKLDIKK